MEPKMEPGIHPDNEVSDLGSGDEEVNVTADAVLSGLSEVEQTLTKLEEFSVQIIHSYLSGSAWKEAFDDFFKFHCPKFKDFDASGDVKGVGFDLGLTAVHREFCVTAEALVEGQLGRLGLAPARFAEVVGLRLAAGRRRRAAAAAGEENSLSSEAKGDMYALSAVLDILNEFEDFLAFGNMMRLKYELIYLSPQSNLDRQGARRTRVLWDLENLPVPRGRDPFAFVRGVTAWLEGRGLAGPGVDARFTAFHCPRKRTISDQAARQLDRAAVEQVLVSDKREDADRKLGIRINQEMQVLPPGRTAFVVLTSDTDFRHHFQLLLNGGFQVFVIHGARDAQCAATLALHATEALCWWDISELQEDNCRQDGNNQQEEITAPSIDGEEISKRKHDKNTTDEEEASQAGCMMNSEISGKIEKSTPLLTTPGGGGVQKTKNIGRSKKCQQPRDFRQQQKHFFVAGHQYTGKCVFWNTAKGWGKIRCHPQESGAQGGGRLPEIFVHNTALPPDAPRRYLERGEELVFTAELNPRGPIALGVRAAAAAQAPGEEGAAAAAPVFLLRCQQQRR